MRRISASVSLFFRRTGRQRRHQTWPLGDKTISKSYSGIIGTTCRVLNIIDGDSTADIRKSDLANHFGAAHLNWSLPLDDASSSALAPQMLTPPENVAIARLE